MPYWLIDLSEVTELTRSEAHTLRQFLIGLRADGPAPVPVSRYVVRAETDLGPVYLRSLTGSLTEWTSEQRYAWRIVNRWDARLFMGDAFCPDASSVSVRRLRKSPGYHVKWTGWETQYVSAPKPELSCENCYSNIFSNRYVFATKAAAKAFVDERVRCRKDITSYLTVVPESPAAGASPQ